MQDFICVCGKRISDEFASKCLDEAQLKKLARMRLGRKIDGDPDLIWCPYLGCEKDVRKVKSGNRVTCTHCNRDACFSCQMKWHEGSCKATQQAGYRFYLCRSDVRQCPRCGVRVEKNGGCPHMACLRCNYDFCWSCMSKEGSCEIKGFPLCPRLPYSMCVNLLITLGAFLLAPIVLTLAPILAGIVFGLVEMPRQIYEKLKYKCGFNYRNTNCATKTCVILLSILIGWIFVLPLILALAVLASALLGSIGTLVFWTLCIVYLVRLTGNTVRGMCKTRR